VLIVGIDPGTKCGWALIDTVGATPPFTGVWDLAIDRGDSPGWRFLKFDSKLEAIATSLGDRRIGLLVYEAQHHRGGSATQVALGLVATLQAWCARRGVEHHSVHTSTLKKFVTGKGNAEKELLIARAATDLHRDIGQITSDEADAYWLARYGEQILEGS